MTDLWYWRLTRLTQISMKWKSNKLTFFFFFFLQWCHKPSKLEATLAQSNKCLSNPKSKWFLQNKTLRSKPKGGMKGVTYLIWNTGTRTHHQHTRENKRRMRRHYKNKTQWQMKQRCQIKERKTRNNLQKEQTNNNTMWSQYSSIKKKKNCKVHNKRPPTQARKCMQG